MDAMSPPDTSRNPFAGADDGFVEKLLAAALAEDLGEHGDITTLHTVGGRGPQARGRIVAKAEGRLSGVGLAERVFALVDPAIVVEVKRHDGDAVAPGDEVLAVSGPAGSLLEAERTALNFLAHLSGVATLTAQFVAAAGGTHCAIVDTRKTTPGFRQLEKAAVVHGGGKNHRIGLFDEVLIKENHLAIAGLDDIKGVVARVRKAVTDRIRITVEAETLDEARAAADGGADCILLDNFTTAALTEAVAKLADHPRRAAFQLEASGNMTLERVPEVAATGVDRISVGALTHSAPVLDLSMLLDARVAAPS